MIINTGSRTDIPAYYSQWFLNRIREGFVLVRNPYNPEHLVRYRLDPSVVDFLCFCTKNPAPLIPHLHQLSDFRQLWFVTITPYGKEIEPGVPPKEKVAADFRALSCKVGEQRVIWRYDPIFITEAYSLEFHIKAFEAMARLLKGSTRTCIISFLDLYETTKRNFPEGKKPEREERHAIGRAFSEIARDCGMRLKTCCEGDELAPYGIDPSGCMTKAVFEEAGGLTLTVPSKNGKARPECSCLLGNDIGQYNTCGHGCRYCYANADPETARIILKHHDPRSPVLIGWPGPGETVTEARQESWVDGQLCFVW